MLCDGYIQRHMWGTVYTTHPSCSQVYGVQTAHEYRYFITMLRSLVHLSTHKQKNLLTLLKYTLRKANNNIINYSHY